MFDRVLNMLVTLKAVVMAIVAGTALVVVVVVVVAAEVMLLLLPSLLQPFLLLLPSTLKMVSDLNSFNPNLPRGGETPPPWYILFLNFLVTHPNFMKLGNFS